MYPIIHTSISYDPLIISHKINKLEGKKDFPEFDIFNKE